MCVCVRARACVREGVREGGSQGERERDCVCVCVCFFKLPGFQRHRISGTLILLNSGVFDYLRVSSPSPFFGGLFQSPILSTGAKFFSFLHFSLCGEFFFPGKLISNKPRSSLSSSPLLLLLLFFVFSPLSLFFCLS